MKNLLWIASAITLAFTSCSLEDKVENVINNSIPAVEQEVSEDFTIEATELEVAGEISESITIDTTEINDQIENARNSGTISIDEITIDDLMVSLSDDSEQENLDFLDSLVLNIYTDNIDEAIEIDFGVIEKGVTSLSLPEGSSTNILSLIEGSNVNDLTIDIDLVTNAPVENNLDLELVSTLLAQLGVNL